jgi:glycosyltransferase involved in cell wall biosynthesis
MLVTARPRLLFISPRFLFPADEGGKIRTSNILRQMKGGRFSITLASPAPADIAPFAGNLSSICDDFLSWPATATARAQRLIALASHLPVSVATDRSEAGRRVVRAAIDAGTDIVVTDFPHAAVLLPRSVDAATVLFTHNVEAEIYERHADISKGLWRSVWRDQARKMARFEGEVCTRHRAVIAVSPRDAASLKKRYGVAADEIVTGVDLAYYSAAPQLPVPADGGTVVFTGVMDSAANIDAVTYFLAEIWPLVLKPRHAATAVIVGRNPPKKLLELAKDPALRVRFTGFVDDIRPHVAGAHVSVIPIRAGGGTRIKAFEAMALGRPVVSTSIGVAGLGLVPGEHFLSADTAGGFADAVVHLFEDAALRQHLSSTGRTLLEERFTWAKVAQQFEEICLKQIPAC